MNKSAYHVVLDLETAGLASNAVVLSAAALIMSPEFIADPSIIRVPDGEPAHPHTPKLVYSSFPVTPQLLVGRTVNKSVIDWWKKNYSMVRHAAAIPSDWELLEYLTRGLDYPGPTAFSAQRVYQGFKSVHSKEGDSEEFKHSFEVDRTLGRRNASVMLRVLAGKKRQWLNLLRQEIASHPLISDAYVWGNSSLFDIAIMGDFLTNIDVNWPFHYRNELCFRTLKTAYAAFRQPSVEYKADYPEVAALLERAPVMTPSKEDIRKSVATGSPKLEMNGLFEVWLRYETARDSGDCYIVSGKDQGGEALVRITEPGIYFSRHGDGTKNFQVGLFCMAHHPAFDVAWEGLELAHMLRG